MLLLDHDCLVAVTSVPPTMHAAIHVMMVVSTLLDHDRFCRGNGRRCYNQRTKCCECESNFLHFKSSSVLSGG